MLHFYLCVLQKNPLPPETGSWGLCVRTMSRFWLILAKKTVSCLAIHPFGQGLSKVSVLLNCLELPADVC